MRGGLGLLLAAMILWGGATRLVPAARGGEGRGEELLYYPSGRFLRPAVLGYEQAAASVAWIRVVQYYGEHAKTDMQFDMMYHLCDVVTDLDARFEEPYIFGAFVLLTEGRRPEDGLKLLEKGRLLCPDSWRLQFESGFVQYIAYRNYPEAARYFRRAAVLPGAPDYTRRFAAFLTEQAGSLEASLLLWTDYRDRTTNPELRRKAEERIGSIRREIESRRREGKS